MVQNYIITASEKFSQEELDFNKKGKFTISQQEKIKDLLKKQNKDFKIFVWIWYAVCLMPAGIAYFSNPVEFFNSPAIAFCSLIFILSIPPLIKKLLNKQAKLSTAGPPLVAKGIPEKKFIVDFEIKDSVICIIKIDRKKFYVSKYIYDLIEEHNLYAFYYIQSFNYKMILSWEKLKY